MKSNTPMERLLNGIIKENPTFVLMLGMCPTLAITTSASNGIGMGLTTTVILAASNLIISLLRDFIPDRVRMPSYIVVVASFVTVVELLLQGFIPALYSALGIYIPLIVVNCIILGRAEAYASKNEPVASLFDGIGMGLGFTVSITCIGIVRELLGSGKIFGFQLLPLADAAAGKIGFEPITIFILAPGAFFVLAALSALQNKLKIGAAKRGIDPSNPENCDGGCASCGNTACREAKAAIEAEGNAAEKEPADGKTGDADSAVTEDGKADSAEPADTQNGNTEDAAPVSEEAEKEPETEAAEDTGFPAEEISEEKPEETEEPVAEEDERGTDES